MNKKVIYLAAILIAAVLIFVSIPQGTEIPFGDENVEGSVVLKYYGITKDGKEIEITPSAPLTVWSNGVEIVSIICRVNAVVTRSDNFVKWVEIDATNVFCTWDIAVPDGSSYVIMTSAPISSDIKNILEWMWVGERGFLVFDSLSTGDLNQYFVTKGYPSFSDRLISYGLSGTLTWEAYSGAGLLISSGSQLFSSGTGIDISYSQSTVTISVTYGPN